MKRRTLHWIPCLALAGCAPSAPPEEDGDGSTTDATSPTEASASESSATAALDETGTTTGEPAGPCLARRHMLLYDAPCSRIAASDIDADGLDDLFVLPTVESFIQPVIFPRTLYTYPGGDPRLGAPELHCCFDVGDAFEIMLVDVNGDGRLDPLMTVDMDHHSGDVGTFFEAVEMLVRGPEGGYLAQSRVTGNRTFNLPTRVAAGTWLPGLTAVAIAREQELALFVADGLTVVEPPPEAFVALPELVRDLGAVDLDGDGLDDVVALLQDRVVLVPNPGDGTLLAPIESVPPSYGTALLVGDLDGVPPLDLVLPNESELTIGLMGPGGPTWQSQPLPVPNAATLVDIDGNGALDLITVTNEALVAHLGAGDGTFDPNALLLSVGAGMEIENIVAGDFDGNGTPELAVCDELGVLVVQVSA